MRRTGWTGDGYDGVRIGMIRMLEFISKLAFSRTKRNRLLVTGSTSLFAIYGEARGANIGG